MNDARLTIAIEDAVESSNPGREAEAVLKAIAGLGYELRSFEKAEEEREEVEKEALEIEVDLDRLKTSIYEYADSLKKLATLASKISCKAADLSEM